MSLRLPPLPLWPAFPFHAALSSPPGKPAPSGTPLGPRMGPAGPLPGGGAATASSAHPGGHRAAARDRRAFSQVLRPPDADIAGVSGQAFVPLLPTSAPLPPLSQPAQPAVAVPASLEDLLPELVRKIAWSGDSRRGAVRLELGAGALEGTTLLVQAEGDRVRVVLNAPAHADLEPWRARIQARLARRGLDVELL
jgi:hypothetical protein